MTPSEVDQSTKQLGVQGSEGTPEVIAAFEILDLEC